MQNEEQYEAVLERKIDIFKQKIEIKSHLIEKHAAIKEFKQRLYHYRNSQCQVRNIRKTWQCLIIFAELVDFLRQKAKVN